MNSLIPAHVTGSWTDKVYPCYLDPNTHWNGFACPYFTQAVAEEVLKDVVPNHYVWKQTEDGYEVHDAEGGTPEFFGAFHTNHGTLYAIGAWGWCWERATP